MHKRIGYINATALLIASLLFGFAVLTSTPDSLRENMHDTLAAVGVSLSVVPNQYNTVAQQLDAKAAQLNQQEAQLNARTQVSNVQITTNNRYGFYSLCMSAVLLVLVSLNFYFDYRRRVAPRRTYSVDLR